MVALEPGVVKPLVYILYFPVFTRIKFIPLTRPSNNFKFFLRQTVSLFSIKAKLTRTKYILRNKGYVESTSKT